MQLKDSDHSILKQILESNLTIQEIESKYPSRNLPKNAYVTRAAPSPTGNPHIGSIYAGLMCERISHSSGPGVFILRIEDTDKAREVEGSMQKITQAFETFKVSYDEGIDQNMQDKGSYGPYLQTKRLPIYWAYIKKLVEENKAYLDFTTEAEITEIREKQKAEKSLIGYYGEWSKWRNATQEQIDEALQNQKPFVIRYKNPNKAGIKITFNDCVKGNVTSDTEFNDVVLLKSDGIPTYHYANIIDDHLMGVNFVIRGDEFISSTPMHLQLYDLMGWEYPKFAHFPTIQIRDKATNNKRKLSKRKDPEANVMYYLEEGFPVEGVWAYLLFLGDPAYEEHTVKTGHVYNPDYKVTEEVFYGKTSSPEFDTQKLEFFCREFLAELSAEQLYDRLMSWCNYTNNSEIKNVLNQNKDYALRVFDIERAGDKKRKDIAKFSDFKTVYGYFFDEIYNETPIQKDIIYQKYKPELVNEILNTFINSYTESINADNFVEMLKNVSNKCGFTTDKKELKENPDKFKGYWGDVPMIIRVVLCTNNKSPDLFQTLDVLGIERVKDRISKFLA